MLYFSLVQGIFNPFA